MGLAQADEDSQMEMQTAAETEFGSKKSGDRQRCRGQSGLFEKRKSNAKNGIFFKQECFIETGLIRWF